MQATLEQMNQSRATLDSVTLESALKDMNNSKTLIEDAFKSALNEMTESKKKLENEIEKHKKEKKYP